MGAARYAVGRARGGVCRWHNGAGSPGRRGHPVAFGRSLWGELAALRGDVGARELLRRHRVAAVAVDDPGVAADVDTPGDLAGDRA